MRLLLCLPGGRAAAFRQYFKSHCRPQPETIQYHELFNEEKGQGKGLVTQRLCKYLLQQLSMFAKTESKYE